MKKILVSLLAFFAVTTAFANDYSKYYQNLDRKSVV